MPQESYLVSSARLMPIIVLHLIDSLQPGGAEEIVANLIAYADPRRVRYHCAALHGPGLVGEEIRQSGASVTYLALHRYAVPAMLARFVRLVREVQPDVINLHLEVSTLFGLLAGRLLRSVKIAATMHALKEQLPAWFYPILRMLIHRADGVVVEDHIAEQQIGALGYPPDRVRYIPIGTSYFDRHATHDDPTPGIRGELGIAADVPVILNVARMIPPKGQAYLLRAFGLLLERRPGCRLIVVGYGPEESALRSLAQALGLADRVIFTGLRRDLDRFYRSADVLAVTALDEAMGVIVPQAMAMGLPIVSFDAGSIGEAIQDGVTGFLTPCGDVEALAAKLAGVLNAEPAHRQRVGQAARERAVAEFSARTMACRYETFYHDLVARS